MNRDVEDRVANFQWGFMFLGFFLLGAGILVTVLEKDLSGMLISFGALGWMCLAMMLSPQFRMDLFGKRFELDETLNPAATLASPARSLRLIPLTESLPKPDEHSRVLVYTQGSDFQGEQFFDVPAEALNEHSFGDSGGQPEVCRQATHWIDTADLASLAGCAGSSLVSVLLEAQPVMADLRARELLKQLADHIENVQNIPVMTWGVQGCHLVNNARQYLAVPIRLPEITRAMIVRAARAHDSNWEGGSKDLHESMRRALLVGFAEAHGIPPGATEEAGWGLRPGPT